jgi:hypothetical protein
MDPSPSSPAAALRADPDVAYRALGEAGVLVHLRTSQIFELNETSRVIWEMLTGGSSIDAIVQALASQFEVDVATAQSETEALIAELRSRGLLAR